MGRETIILLLLGLLIVSATIVPTTTKYKYGLLTTSPQNTGIGGTSLYYKDLQHIYKIPVFLGGVEKALSYDNGITLYIILGPDKPFNTHESLQIADAVRRGQIYLLIADESSNTTNLLTALGIDPEKTILYNKSRETYGPGWGYIVGIECGQLWSYTSKVAKLNPGENGNIVCRYEDGSAAAILYHVGKGKVLVVGDSSIFANYLYTGYFENIPGTRQIAIYLTGLVADGVDRIVIDDTHYYAISEKERNMIVSLVDQLSDTIDSYKENINNRSWYWIVFAFLFASIPLPLVLLYPGNKPVPGTSKLDEAEMLLTGILALRLGLDREEADIDSLLKYLEKRGG